MATGDWFRYLDNGVVFVGSSYGDSQLIRLSPQPVPGPPGAPPTFLEVLETFTNLGPIVDFAVVDLERQGQGQVLLFRSSIETHCHAPLACCINCRGAAAVPSFKLSCECTLMFDCQPIQWTKTWQTDDHGHSAHAVYSSACLPLMLRGALQVVTCSGVHADGSLRIVRNGIGMIEQATVELSGESCARNRTMADASQTHVTRASSALSRSAGLRGIWSLKATSMDAFDTFLVLTFVGETRILAINADDELDEADIEGFDSEAQVSTCSVSSCLLRRKLILTWQRHMTIFCCSQTLTYHTS